VGYKPAAPVPVNGGRAGRVVIPASLLKKASMKSKSFRGALMTALATASLSVLAQAAVAAHAPKVAPQAIPPQAKAWLAANAKAKPDQGALQVTAADTLPPSLTVFNAAASVDVGIPGSALVASFKATDDLSGVRSIYAWAYGPSGQYIDVNTYLAVPVTKPTGKMHSNGVPAFLEPGVYTFQGAYIYDTAGNYQYVDGATLATLGKVDFTVKNKKGFDVSKPSIQSGKIVTPRVSLSATHAGTDQPTFAQVTVAATDAGNSALSGVQSANVTFCLLDQSSCFSLSSSSGETVPMAFNASLKLGGQISTTTPQGEYHMHSMMVYDYAGNYLYLYGTQFGGATDFSTYFPSTTITLIP
jgi:hypothetical protein